MMRCKINLLCLKYGILYRSKDRVVFQQEISDKTKPPRPNMDSSGWKCLRSEMNPHFQNQSDRCKLKRSYHCASDHLGALLSEKMKSKGNICLVLVSLMRISVQCLKQILPDLCLAWSMLMIFVHRCMNSQLETIACASLSYSFLLGSVGKAISLKKTNLPIADNKIISHSHNILP